MANKSKNKINESLEKKIRELAKARAQCMLEKAGGSIADALGTIYEKIISDFYKDYTPDYYVRTYTTYQAGLNITTPSARISNPRARIKSKTTETSNGFCKTIKVMVSSEFMQPKRTRSNQYRQPVDEVFDRTFNKGIHGVSRLFNDMEASNTEKKNNLRGVKVVRADRTPAIRWKKSMEGFVKSKNGPRLNGISSTCSLDYIMRESYEYARKKIR